MIIHIADFRILELSYVWDGIAMSDYNSAMERVPS